MFHQTFEPHDLFVICLLMALEGMLSMDNALVMGLLARRLPKTLRPKALTYGLFGSLVFRVLAIGAASALLRWRIIELIGGVYLLYVAIRHLWKPESNANANTDPPAVDRQGKPILIDEETGLPLSEEQLGEEMAEQTHGQIRTRELDYSDVHSTHERAFWIVVATIEGADILFAIDSILAAVALIGPAPRGTPLTQPHPKLWVVVAGGMGGVVLMRFAAAVFIKLLDRFPRFENSAYLLVLLVGGKMVLDYCLNAIPGALGVDFNNPHAVAAWVFWGLIIAALASGFVPARTRS